MRRWQRYRRRLVARSLKLPEPLFVLDAREIDEAVALSWR